MKSDVKSNNIMVKNNKTKDLKIIKTKLKAKKSNEKITSPISDIINNSARTSLVKKNKAKKQLHNYDITKGKREDQHKNEDSEKIMTQNIPKRTLQISPKTKNVNKKMKTASQRFAESLQNFEFSKRNVEHQISPKTKNVNKKMKNTSLFAKDPESLQNFEWFKRNIENAITILNETSHKLKDLKKLNNINQKR